MSFNTDNIIHQNGGAQSSGTTITVSLAGADTTTTGNGVIVCMFSPNSQAITVPTGWQTLKTIDNVQSIRFGVYHLPDAGSGASSWGFSQTLSAPVLWVVLEISNLDPVDPLDVTAFTGAATLAAGATLSTGTTPRCAGLATMELAFFQTGWGTGAHTWSSYTNGFTEILNVPGPGTSGAYECSVAAKNLEGATSTFETTATVNIAAGGGARAVVAVFRAADAPVATPLAQISSLGKWQTHGGMGNFNPNNPHGGQQGVSVGTNLVVASGAARDGGYGVQITESAANNNLPLNSATWGYGAIAAGFNVRVVSGSGVVVVAKFTTTTTTFDLVYDVSNTQFGVRWNAGTVSYQTDTTALNTWTWFDIRVKVNSATHYLEWWLEGVAQTAPADLTSQTASTVSGVTLANATQTMVTQYSDFVASRYYSAGPLGRHWFYLLIPETTGATVSGTSTNFQRFTANGTLANVDGTEGALLDEVPPTVSASADGVVQVTTAASDYINLPMTTYTCAADEMIAAVRALAPAWGGTGAGTGTLGLRGYDGTTETTILSALASYDAGSPTAVDATNPLWIHGMWPPAGAGWTQTMLNAAALRVGFSTDATPDMGVSALYLEVAVKKAATARQITLEDPMSATVDLIMNTDTSASVSYVVTNSDAARSVNLNYSVSGTPQTPVTVSPASSQTVTVNADNYGDISDLSLEPQ